MGKLSWLLPLSAQCPWHGTSLQRRLYTHFLMRKAPAWIGNFCHPLTLFEFNFTVGLLEINQNLNSQPCFTGKIGYENESTCLSPCLGRASYHIMITFHCILYFFLMTVGVHTSLHALRLIPRILTRVTMRGLELVNIGGKPNVWPLSYPSRLFHCILY